MTTKKPCMNVPSCSFTGKEQSPLRYGLSAEGYPLNSVMEGHDKHLWAVEIKNNKKVWVRKEESFKVTHEEPVIKDENNIPTKTLVNDDQQIKNTTNITNTVTSQQPVPILTDVVEKKTTDYNLFLSYRLKQLKDTSKDLDNKKIFSKVIEEWKDVKTKPEELRKILEEAKKCSYEKPVKKTIKKKSAKDTTSEVTSDIKLEKIEQQQAVTTNTLNKQDVVSVQCTPPEVTEDIKFDKPEDSTNTKEEAKVEKKTKTSKKVNKK